VTTLNASRWVQMPQQAPVRIGISFRVVDGEPAQRIPQLS